MRSDRRRAARRAQFGGLLRPAIWEYSFLGSDTEHEDVSAREDKGLKADMSSSAGSRPEDGRHLREVGSVRIVTSMLDRERDAIAEISDQLRGADVGFLLVFASSRYQPEHLVANLDELLPGVIYAGCSTAGEIGLAGVMDSSIVAIAFPSSEYSIVCTTLDNLSEFSIEKGSELITNLRRRLPPLPEGERHNTFALTLLDGLCRQEELVLSALQRALDDIPLVGGSSGDDLTFGNTFAFVNGKALRDAGLLILISSDRPFQVFKSDHFDPTQKKLVVTACDPAARVVSELDAEPAALAFAEAAGIDPAALSAMSFAAHPLLVRVGGEYYCRSIQKLHDDGSLSFYCAIDTGVVLTVARTRDMVKSLEDVLQQLDRELDGIDFVLGFDCVHRRLEAESRQVIRQVSDLFKAYRVVGFNTYGEQFNAMHLNHTFTGVAFGRRKESV